MKLVSRSLLGLTAAIAGLLPASGQELDCDALMADSNACSSLVGSTTCEGDGKTQLELAVCCAAADVAVADQVVEDAEAALVEAQDAIDRAVAAHADAQEFLGDKEDELTATKDTLTAKEQELEERCTPPPPPPPSGWTPTIGQTWVRTTWQAATFDS